MIVQNVSQQDIQEAEKALKELFDELDLNEKEREETQQNLVAAISAATLTILGEKLPKEKIEELKSKKPENIEDVAKFFKDHYSADEIQAALKSSTEDVMQDFLSRLE